MRDFRIKYSLYTEIYTGLHVTIYENSSLSYFMVRGLHVTIYSSRGKVNSLLEPTVIVEAR